MASSKTVTSTLTKPSTTASRKATTKPVKPPKVKTEPPKFKNETWDEYLQRHRMRRGGEVIGPDWPAVKANITTVGMGWLIMTYLTPPIEQCAEFNFDWMYPVFLRTFLIGFCIYEGVHQVMYKSQRYKGTFTKINKRWPPESQHNRDRKYTCMSFLINAAMECYLLQAWSSGRVPYYLDASQHPGKTFLMFVAYPFWRDIHFFLYHYPMHIEPFYKYIHAHHHRSWNTGPWSGLSMTPAESIVTFTGPSIPCLVTAAHPLLFFYANMLAFVNPVYGHHGHEEWAGSYFHYLHHSRVTCNYGMTFTPVDLLTGTWCTGEKEDEFLEKIEKERPEGWTPTAHKWGSMNND